MPDFYKTEAHKPALPKPSISKDTEPDVSEYNNKNFQTAYPLPDTTKELLEFAFFRSGYAILELERSAEAARRVGLKKEFNLLLKLVAQIDTIRDDIRNSESRKNKKR